MKHRFLFFLMKTTGYILDKIYYKRKIYYEDKYVQKRKVNGGALIVSNHTNFKDYISYFFTFFFRKLYVVTGSIFYTHNIFLNIVLKTIGAIKVNDKYNFNFIEKSVNLINRDKLVLIFPEAHYSTDGDIKDFHTSYINIALKTNKPIIPVYNNGVFSFFKRNRIIIGKPIYPKDYIKNNTVEEINKFNIIVQNKIKYLKSLLENKKKNRVFSFKYLFNDLGRIVTLLFIRPLFRIKIHYRGKTNPLLISNRYIVCSNHTSFYDPILLLSVFYRRRINILTAKEVFGNKKIRSFFLRGIGCIKIDRDIFDIDAINSCVELLNKEKVIVVFPGGHINSSENSEALKLGAGLLSVQTNSPILPIYICREKRKFNLYIMDSINQNKLEYNNINTNDKIKTITDELYNKIEEGKLLASK